jgi:ribose 5-phosphate isomerase A
MTIIERALDLVPDDSLIGRSSAARPSSAPWERVHSGTLRVRGLPSCEKTAALARKVSIPLPTLAEASVLDLTVDGADEVDPNLDLIKGYGRTLVQEKIVAAASRRLVRSRSRDWERGGKLPVEVVPFALPLCERRLRELGCHPAGPGQPSSYDRQWQLHPRLRG